MSGFDPRLFLTCTTQPSRALCLPLAASPSILVALLICCSARNTVHVGDLYPASSNSSVCWVSFQIDIISACLWPPQHSCFFRNFHPLLMIVHPRPGSRHDWLMLLLSLRKKKSSNIAGSSMCSNPFFRFMNISFFLIFFCWLLYGLYQSLPPASLN